MKLTKVGKWLLEAFLNKEPEEGDFTFSHIITVLQDIDEGMEKIENAEYWENISKEIGLLEED